MYAVFLWVERESEHEAKDAVERLISEALREPRRDEGAQASKSLRPPALTLSLTSQVSVGERQRGSLGGQRGPE